MWHENRTGSWMEGKRHNGRCCSSWSQLSKDSEFENAVTTMVIFPVSVATVICVRLPLCFREQTLKYLGDKGIMFTTYSKTVQEKLWRGREGERMCQIFTLGKNDWRPYGTSLNQPCNFSLSSKWFQYYKFKFWVKQKHFLCAGSHLKDLTCIKSLNSHNSWGKCYYGNLWKRRPREVK